MIDITAWLECVSDLMAASAASSSIILVGPSQSGKSTLGLQLAKDRDTYYYHVGGSPPNEEECLNCIYNQIEAMKLGCVIDRLTPFCDEIFGDRQEVVHHFYAIMRDIILSDLTVIHLTNVGIPVRKPGFTDHHMDNLLRNRLDIAKKYEAILGGKQVLKYDWNQLTYEQLLEKIK